jgi:DNA-directed RNA polymerase subunit beta'
MKEYIKINIASPRRILQWTERALPDGKLIGEITKSKRF